MAKVRCQYCHENIEAGLYSAHEAEHLRLRPDGQQSEYATLPPEEREHGDLSGVPMAYLHEKCGTVTVMPEQIVRSYLKNPYLYSADSTFCVACRIQVPFRNCKWTDTGENLQKYMNRLRAEKPELRPGFLTRMVIGIVKFFG